MNGPPARAAVALVILFGSAACGSLFENKSEPVAVYLLSATLAMPPAAIAADLQVRRPKVRTGLNSDHIAVLYPDHHLDFYAGARWSGPLDEVVRDLELQAFRAGSGLRSVSEDGSHFGGYWLEVEVVDFQAETDGASPPTVHVRFLARIGDSTDGRVLGTFEAAAQQAAAGNRLSAIVEAYNRAAGDALARLVAHSDALLGAFKTSTGRSPP